MKNQKRFIILTDDDKDEHVLFKEVAEEFKEIDCLISFEKASDLLEYLNDSSQISPHIIFLDLNMPTISGFECLFEIKSNEAFKNVKIVIYSTSCSEKDVKTTFDMGADLYVTKPSNFYHMRELVEKVLEYNWDQSALNRNLNNYKLIL